MVIVFDLNFVTGFLPALAISGWKGLKNARRTTWSSKTRLSSNRAAIGQQSDTPSSFFNQFPIALDLQRLDLSTYTILQILSLTLFKKMSILRALSGVDCKNQEDDLLNQLKLFNY